MKCLAITKQNLKCQNRKSPSSNYCNLHQTSNSQPLTLHQIQSELKKSEYRNIIITLLITIVATVIGFGTSYFFFLQGVEASIDSLNETSWMTSPVILKLNDTINESEGRWYINITNTHPIRSTGQIYIYKLEIDPHKPNMALNESLGPGQSTSISLTIKSRKENISFNQNLDMYGMSIQFPFYKSYYAMHHMSISLRITCDTCTSQGMLLRLPDFDLVPFSLQYSNQGAKNLTLPSYEWIDFTLEDLKTTT